jgi:hypothetical protein
MLASRERREMSLALTSTLHWFETEVLAEDRNYQGLVRLNTPLVQHEAARPLARRLILDIDSSESPIHGAESSQPTIGTSSPCATIRSSSSTSTATAWPPRSGPATSTVRTSGRRPSRPSLTATRLGSGRRRPNRRGLCAAHSLRCAEQAGRGLCHPAPGQSGTGAEDRALAHPVPRPTQLRPVGAVSKLSVSGHVVAGRGG